MDWITSLLQVSCPFCEKTLGNCARACQHCANRLSEFSMTPVKLFKIHDFPVVACLDYQDWIRELILKQKTSPNKIVTKWMANLLHEKMPQEWKTIPCVWIPGHSLQNLHLVEMLMLELNCLGQPLIRHPPLFRKLKKTKAQKELSVAERKNFKRVEKFYISNFFSKQYPKQVLLIDDVMTTGSTLKNCAQLLEKNLSMKVKGAIVLAHTPLKRDC